MKSIAVIEECLWGDKPWVCPTDPSRASASFVEIGARTTSLVLSWQKTAKAPNRHRMLLGVRYYWRVALSRVNHVKYCQIMLYIVHLGSEALSIYYEIGVNPFYIMQQHHVFYRIIAPHVLFYDALNSYQYHDVFWWSSLSWLSLFISHLDLYIVDSLKIVNSLVCLWCFIVSCDTRPYYIYIIYIIYYIYTYNYIYIYLYIYICTGISQRVCNVQPMSIHV